jgi:hypothetical protein
MKHLLFVLTAILAMLTIAQLVGTIIRLDELNDYIRPVYLIYNVVAAVVTFRLLIFTYNELKKK